MKRIALVLVIVSAVVAAGYFAFPDEAAQYAGVAAGAAERVRANVEANPTPVALALGTFLLTVVYHKARGKSLRESVEVAATRVTVVSAPPPTSDEGEASVVRRARARATRTQLMSDLVVLQNRHRKLPDEILQFEKEVCYAEQALDEAEAKLAQRRKVREAAAAKLDAARKEKAEADAEVVAIEVELKRLADVA
ncbi:hypothetical protein [Gemmata sp.]|uniref:hypothetical protein n=1 Tax=Gemmata sp. TaxID=1914242 RepID=UPI003F6EFB91